MRRMEYEIDGCILVVLGFDVDNEYLINAPMLVIIKMFYYNLIRLK